MMGRALKFWFPLIVLLSFPALAFADAGTPLLLAAGFHLFIGNTIIGIAEGLILALVFKRRKWSCVLIMIPANYFSAFVGSLCGLYIANEVANISIYNVRRWVWIMLGVSYLLTLALEWPFVALCLRKCDHWFKKSLWGSLIVQSASYLVLLIGYWLVSVTSLWTGIAIVQPSEIAMPAGVTVYYIAENDRDVYALDLHRGATKEVYELKLSAHWDRLCLRKTPGDAGRWDIVAESSPSDDAARETVLAAATNRAAEGSQQFPYPFGGEVPRFPDEDHSGWQFHFGWMAGRLSGDNTIDGRKMDIGLETPFLRWPVLNPTQLPNGQVVFQLGKDQICILDPDAKKVALIAKGYGPAIVLSDKPD